MSKLAKIRSCHAAKGGALNRFSLLDGLRGFAALLVVAQHYGFAEGYEFLYFGEFAVDLFFFLSSFLLTGNFYSKILSQISGPPGDSVTKAKDSRLPSSQNWRNLFTLSFLYELIKYAVRRLMRVYPLFVAVLLVLQLDPKCRRGFFMQEEQFDFFKVFSFTEGYTFHVFWTLPIELYYYLYIPIIALIAAAIPSRSNIRLIIVLIFALYVGYEGFMPRFVHTTFDQHKSTFLLGSAYAILNYHLQKSVLLVEIGMQNRKIFLVKEMIIGCLGLLIASQVTNHFLWSYMEKPAYLNPGGSVPFTNIFLGPLFLMELTWPGWLTTILTWSVFTYSGKVSYSIYLLHSFPLYLYEELKHDSWDRFFLTWFGTFALATIGFYFLERPFQILTDYFCKAFRTSDRVVADKGYIPVDIESPTSLISGSDVTLQDLQLVSPVDHGRAGQIDYDVAKMA